MTQTLLKEMTNKKIDYLLSKHTIRDVDVYTVIKEFFKEYLHANYEFTFDELAEELKKIYIEKQVKDSLFRLIKDFSTIEYKDEEIPQEVLRNILSTFAKLVDSLIKKEEQKGGLFSKLFGPKAPPADAAAKQLSGLEEQAIRKETLPAEQPPSNPSQPAEEPAPQQPTPPEHEEPPILREPQGKAPLLDDSEFEVPSFSQEELKQPIQQAEPVAKEERPAEENTGKAPEGLDAPPKDTPSPSFAHNWTDDAATEDLPRQQEQFSFEEQQPHQEPPALEPTPTQQTNTPPTQSPPTPIPQSPPATAAKPEIYFGNEDEALSNDLNVLAEQLDEVIREEEVKPAQAADPMQQLITRVDDLADQRDMAGAQQAYKELIAKYNALSEHDKHHYYDKIQSLYNSLQRPA